MKSLAPLPCTLRQLQYAVAVAEALSFRRAAERCRVAQPSLSSQVAELEAALGVQLFERDRRRVLVTTAGQEVIERARRLLRDAGDLVEAASRGRDPLSGALRVGVIPTIAPYLLPVASPALRAAFPALTLLWTEERTATLVQGLEAGELDAALLALEAELGAVEKAVVGRDPFVLAGRPGDPLLRGRGAIEVGALRGATVLLLEDGHCFREQALDVCARARAQELEFRATSLPTLAQMVASGLGVTLLPKMAVATEAARAGLRVRPFEKEKGPARTIALAWRRGAAIGEALGAVAGVIRGAYPGPA